jgi:hypothetical protein
MVIRLILLLTLKLVISQNITEPNCYLTGQPAVDVINLNPSLHHLSPNVTNIIATKLAAELFTTKTYKRVLAIYSREHVIESIQI